MTEGPPQNRDVAARAPRRRRRPARRTQLDTTVASPCINVCQLDDATGLCLGCLRTIDEIRDWPILSAADKTAILARIAARKTGPSPR